MRPLIWAMWIVILGIPVLVGLVVGIFQSQRRTDSILKERAQLGEPGFDSNSSEPAPQVGRDQERKRAG